jgi:salicylate 1-O-methyltransferase
MEGRGFYNTHSRPQQAAARHGIELLVQAAGQLDPGPPPLVIADYGSAEGRNSLAPISAAIRAVRQAHRTPITVVHLDRPNNDFASLFELLRTDPGSYLEPADEVFALASGGSFYEQMLPPNHASLGWCSIALHWLSRVPVSPGHAWPTMRTGLDRAPFAAQAALDWVTFLKHRAVELRPGGALVVVVPASDRDGCWSLAGLARHVMATLEEMTTGGTLDPGELARMLVPNYDRTLDELEAPFADPELGLRLEEARLDYVADPIWEAYRASGDVGTLAEGYAGFVRAAFGPTLVAAMNAERPADARREFLGALDAGLRRRILAEPAALCEPTVATLLIVKAAARP